MLELILLYFGLTALLSGSLGVGGGREATGVGARVAGAILCLPLPVTLLILLAGAGESGEDVFSYYWKHGIFWVELGLVLFCGLTGYMVAGISASSRGYRDREMRYHTESRDDIFVPRSDFATLVRGVGEVGDASQVLDEQGTCVLFKCDFATSPPSRPP